jgi:hypothetical protein
MFDSETDEEGVEQTDYVAYSLRRCPATNAAGCSELSLQQIISRGGWTLDAVSTVSEYIAGSGASDQRVGRVLVGWPYADKWGNPLVFCNTTEGEA